MGFLHWVAPGTGGGLVGGCLFSKRQKRSTKKMKGSRKTGLRKKRGRPATGQNPVTAIRLSAELRKAVDNWAANQSDSPSRSEAIRRLVEQTLDGPSLSIPVRKLGVFK